MGKSDKIICVPAFEPDGSVRWYAAETVPDEGGRPVTVPRG